MLFNYRRNKRMYNLYANTCDGYCSDGSYIENVLFKAKNNDYFLIRHIQYADEIGELTHQGIYKIINNKHERIGFLKYTFCDSDPSNIYMNLGDIYFQSTYRNIGLGTKTITLFEKRAKEYGAQYITGKLSSVDEKTIEDKTLRDTFYQKSGYDVNNENLYKKLS